MWAVRTLAGCYSVVRGRFPQRRPAISRAKYRLAMSFLSQGSGTEMVRMLCRIRDGPSEGLVGLAMGCWG